MAEGGAEMVMTAEALRSKLVGPIAFPVTPFASDLSVDLDGLRRNLRVMREHRFAAIVAAGGTGELYSLTPQEHLAVVSATVEEVGGRMPVIAGAGYSTAIGTELAKQGASAGASGILAFPPYYPGADEDGLFEYYRTIGAATPLGMLIYSRDWFHPGESFVQRLATIPTLMAWKDGQGDIRRLQIIRARVGDRLHWIGGAGDDLVPAYYAMGIRSYTSSIANLSPAMAVQLHEAAAAGDLPVLQRLMGELVIPLYALRARRRGYEVTVVKELMNLLGLTGGFVRPPLPSMTTADVSALGPVAALWRAAG